MPLMFSYPRIYKKNGSVPVTLCFLLKRSSIISLGHWMYLASLAQETQTCYPAYQDLVEGKMV